MARSVRLAAVAAMALALSVCGETPTGPSDNRGPLSRLAFQPELRPSERPLFQASGLTIDNVYLVIRNSAGDIVFERIVPFPAGQNEIAISADVPVNGESERFRASFELRSGTTAMYSGVQEVVARPGFNAPTPTTVPLQFVGPGANAAFVRVSPATPTLLSGATATLVATAVSTNDQPLGNVPFVWSSSDPTLVDVNPSGGITAGSRRGTATITASTLSGVRGTADVTVTLPPASVTVESPAGLTGRVGSTLTAPFTVRVLASDNVAVPNTVVTFAALSNGAQVGSASVTTDATGRASTTMTLGGTLGPQSFRATVAGVTPVTLAVDATVGLPDAISITGGNPQSANIGLALPQPFAVRVADRFDNPVPNASVAWARIAGNGTLSAATSTTDAEGRTQVNYTLGSIPGAETVRATVTTANGTATATFNATAIALPASRIVIVSGDPQGGTVGSAAAQPLVVRVTDALNNNIQGATVAWTVTGPATISATSTQTAADGTTQVTAAYGNQPGGVTVRATLGSVSVAFALTASVGAPAKIVVLAGGGQTAQVSTAVAVAPSVLVTDQFDNPTGGVSVTFAASGGGAVTGSPAITNSSGIATLGSWTLGAVAGPQALTVTAGSATTSIGATATAPVGPPVLSVATQPSATAQNTVPFAQQPAVQLKNAAGAILNTAGVVVTVALQTPGPALRGTLTATTNASGVATFTDLSVLGPLGTNALVFTAGGYTGATSATFNIVVGPAATISATTATAFGATVGSIVTPVPQVLVRDSALVPVAGVAVTWATPGPGNGGLITGGGPVTDAAGLSSPVQWTLDAVPGTDVLTATVAGLVGSPVTFTATTTAGAATQLLIVSGHAQTGVTGNPLALPMVVVAKDALNNVVSGVNVTFTVTAGGGTPTTQTIATDVAGQASFALTLGAPGGHAVQACLPSCATAQVLFSAMSIPVGADAIWTGSANTGWSNAANWSPPVVPTSANNVFIPSGTPNSPNLFGSVSVNHLTVASGASLSLSGYNMTVGGDVLATGATMTGNGQLLFCGGTHQIAGGVNGMTINCGATINPVGTGTINGTITLMNGSVFDVATSDFVVSGSVGVFSGSRMKMTAAAGKLTVNGDYTSEPNNDIGDTWMTDGVLELKGSLYATSSCCSQSFRAVGNHITRFSGSGPQTIDFYYADNFNRSTFGHVEFTGGNTVTLTNDLRVLGSVVVNNNTVVTGSGRTIFHVGSLTTTAGTNLAGLASTQQNGAGTIPQIAGTAPPTVEVNGNFTVTLPAASVTVPGNLALYGGAVLDLEGKSLTVNGNFGMYSGSRVKMINPAAYFRVDGTYDSNPNNDIGDSWMTDGVLELKGNLLATSSCCSQSFRAVGNHLTRFSGTAPQTINFYYADHYGRSTFGKVEFGGGNTVTLTNDLRVWGSVVVNNNTVVTGSGRTIFHVGSLTTTAGTSLAGLASTQQNGGGTFPEIAGAPPPTVELNGGFTATLPASPLTLPTNLALYGGAVLDIGANNLTITGNLSLTTGSGSRLKMNNAAGILTVHGNASFSALDAGTGDLTAGVFELRGNFSAGTYGQAFLATGSHLMRFAGTGAQSVFLQYTGGSQSQFASVEITNASAAGVTPTSNIPIAGNLTQLGKLTITSVAVNVTGNIGLGNGSITVVAGGALNRGGTCSIISGTPLTISGFSCP